VSGVQRGRTLDTKASVHLNTAFCAQHKKFRTHVRLQSAISDSKLHGKLSGEERTRRRGSLLVWSKRSEHRLWRECKTVNKRLRMVKWKGNQTHE